jgi:hypothetical protein
MKVALNTTYSSDLNDTSSDEYAAFTKDFCSEVGIWINFYNVNLNEIDNLQSLGS